MGPADTSTTAELGVDDVESLTFAHRYDAPWGHVDLYRSSFPEPWGFDYAASDLEGRPRELIWVESGMMTAQSGARRWMLGPENAIWLPSGTASEVIPNLPSRAFCLQFAAAHPGRDPQSPTMFRVSPLARELLLRLGGDGVPTDSAVLSLELLIAELVPLATDRHTLTLPADPRIRGIAAGILAEPGDRCTLAEVAASAFCSTKTVQRAFRAETGMTFAAWRRVARVLSSLTLLEEGVPVVATSPRVGFTDVGAYIDAFRAHFGCTPGQYAARAGGRGTGEHGN